MAAVTQFTIDVQLKRYPAAGNAPPVEALKALRFDVAVGEFACIVGPSGCGKTTLLNIVAGLDADFMGKVDFSARAGASHPRVGYVFQRPRLLPWRTVEENIRLVLSPEQNRSGIVDDLLAATGLGEARHTYPERLSVGMSRRAALARAFAIEPDLLLMDEPFVSLDEATAERLRVLLLDIWGGRPTTVLFVTHDTREAAQLADRVIVLTSSPGSVRSIVAIDTPRQSRGHGDVIDTIRQQILRPAALLTG
jgi:ABC-type nitrate/sulfonate/bicarbonate transport system ATPase subunit